MKPSTAISEQIFSQLIFFLNWWSGYDDPRGGWRIGRFGND